MRLGASVRFGRLVSDWGEHVYERYVILARHGPDEADHFCSIHADPVLLLDPLDAT